LFLGLSVIPGWENALNNMLNLLNKNGKIVIVDVFAKNRNFNIRLVEKFAKADLNREVWQTHQKRTTHFWVRIPTTL
jgi:threonine dehydrogenase-like Zn-dependent dehydrogenase